MTATSRPVGPAPPTPRGFGLLLVALTFVVAIVAVAGIGEGYRGIQTERLTHDSNAVQVQAVVDRVARRCRDDGGPNGVTRRSCVYDSYGHYRVGTDTETDVLVMRGSPACVPPATAGCPRSPLGSRLELLVDPADPRIVAPPGASGVIGIVFGVFGVLLVVATALGWVLRRRFVARRRARYRTNSPK